jgi:hypothetical protein
LIPVGGDRWWGKEERQWIQCKKCVHMNVNAKIIPFETIPGMGGRVDKGEWRRWTQIWYIWYIVRTFINATMYHYPEKQ